MTGRVPRRRRALGDVMLAAVLVVVSTAAPRSATASDLEQANLRWKDARCQLRLPLVILKKKNSDGWSYTPWYTVTDSKPEFNYRFYVSDRKRVAHLIYDKTLRPGTTFICQGWRMEEGKGSRSLWLDLRFASVPVDA